MSMQSWVSPAYGNNLFPIKAAKPRPVNPFHYQPPGPGIPQAPPPTPQPAPSSGMPQQQAFRPRRPQFNMQGFYNSQNPAARAMGWAGAVNFNRGRQQQQAGYDMAATQYQNELHRNAQSQRDQTMRFGLGALTGLMR